VSDVGAVIVTGNYASEWGSGGLDAALSGKFVVLIDTLMNSLIDRAHVVIPGATWAEKAGTFENARGVLQAFEQAIPVIQLAKSEGQIALDMHAAMDGAPAPIDSVVPVVVQSSPGQVAAGTQQVLPRATAFNAANVRREMAEKIPALGVMTSDVKLPSVAVEQRADVEMVEI